MAKMYLGETPIQSLNIHQYDISTNDATAISSDFQAGVTAYARGQKITGTGKAFEFANYGTITTNVQNFVPTLVNVVEISGLNYPTKSLIDLSQINNIDFTTEQTIAVVIVDNVEYPITVEVEGYALTFNCEKTITLNYFLGKDRYI